ncbi:MAG: O-antigen ligase family protein [Patescibacteria group bacterium]
MNRFWPTTRIGQFFLMLTIFLMVELLSFASFFSEMMQNVLLVFFTLAFILIALKNYSWALVLLILELILGSKGYLFAFNQGETLVSLRLAWFITAIAIFVVNILKYHRWKALNHKLVYGWLLALLAISWGAVNGLFNNSFTDWFLDLNGYLYLLIFLPLLCYQKTIWFKLKSVVAPALIYLAVKTLYYLYLYSHFPADSLLPLYHWFRDTGFGEITYISGNFFRIFSQSQIFILIAVVAWFIYWLILAHKRNQSTYTLVKHNFLLYLGGLILTATLLASFSRSFWLAAGVTLVIGLISYVIIRRPQVKHVLDYLGFSLLTAVASAGLLLAITQFPIPTPLAAVDSQLFVSRASQGASEAAGASRLQLLGPLWQGIQTQWLGGGGFGSTVAYYTSDPRITKSTAGGSGLVTTYAFEWGYLDIWLKLGLIGLLLYLSFWLYLFKKGISYLPSDNVVWFILLAALAIAITNLTTPYLNHPLGIGSLVILGLYINWHLNEISEQTI